VAATIIRISRKVLYPTPRELDGTVLILVDSVRIPLVGRWKQGRVIRVQSDDLLPTLG